MPMPIPLQPDITLTRPRRTINAATLEDRDRTAVIAALQFTPSDNLEINLDGFYSDYDRDRLESNSEVRWQNFLANGGVVNSVTVR